MTSFKARMIRAFGDADRYDSYAEVQRRVAEALARRIGPLPEGARILELGCGTGFLADAAAPIPADADWLMTDVSPAMVERSRSRFGTLPGYRFAVVDAEQPRFEPPEIAFDRIVSSLAAQWFVDLEGTLERMFALLKPGGLLLLSTLAGDTFAEWRAAHGTHGLAAGTPCYPDRSAFEAMRIGGQQAEVAMDRFSASYRDGRDFLRTLRAIGAGTPRAGHKPLTPGAMRNVLRSFEATGATVTYEVAFLAFQRAETR
jgi:malonyl-CoA O-methyltransferase